MSAPRIAFVTPVMPAEAGNGLAMRAGVSLEALASVGTVHVVVVNAFGLPVNPPGALVRRHAAAVDVIEPTPAPDPMGDVVARLATVAGRARAGAVHPLPRLSRGATMAAAAEVARLTEGAAAVHVLRLYLAPYLDAVLDQRDRPVLVLDVDDVESVFHHRWGQAEEAERYERLEGHYLPLVDHVVACSDVDARWLSARYGLPRVTAVPNAVRLPRGGPGAAPFHDLLFVANLGYQPNIAGAEWLCRVVAVHPALVDATVALVGSRPGPAVRALASAGRVIVAADVPAVGPWYASGRVAVVPLPAGGGTRLKVIEAMAHGRPVVSTSAGAEGLDFGPGESPLVIADTAGDFATACRRLLDDPAEAAARAVAGEAWVRQHATVEVIGPRLAALLREELRRHGKP